MQAHLTTGHSGRQSVRLASDQPLPKAFLLSCPAGALITMHEAAKVSGAHRDTIRRWVKNYGIGDRLLGRVVLHRVGFRLLLAGDMAGLAEFRAGNFTDERVSAAFDAEGLGLPQSEPPQAVA